MLSHSAITVRVCTNIRAHVLGRGDDEQCDGFGIFCEGLYEVCSRAANTCETMALARSRGVTGAEMNCAVSPVLGLCSLVGWIFCLPCSIV